MAPTQPGTLKELADQIDPKAAQMFAAQVLTILGSAESWGGDEMSRINDALIASDIGRGRPHWYEQNDAELNYWQSL
ncbi:hypothetical protein MUG78_17815 [Gordonia alkaliphila]|uniref:hypothetical protein n=1 Tax=Gordonia alkaliphila TaxID=1053547 RepID=UPI001FF1E9E3|nr:hypothetical protein [Gordonia alkaliphila]MCK0441259.1 hypothetical protein [Gordonia alkaliphila]